MDTVKLMKVIFCDTKRKGKGTEGDPIRVVPQIFTLKGKLIAENDSEVKYTSIDLVKFANYVIDCKLKNPNESVIVDLVKQWEIHEDMKTLPY